MSKYAIYYPQITSLFTENYIRQMASVYINALLQTCLEVAVHEPPWVLINSRNFVNNILYEFLNSHNTPPEHPVFQEPPQEKIWYCKFRRPSRPSDVAETRDNSSEHFPNNSHTVLCGVGCCSILLKMKGSGVNAKPSKLRFNKAFQQSDITF